MKKFSSVGRLHLAQSLETLRNNESCAKYALKFLRPAVRGMILSVAAGERITPEFIRVVLSGCLKIASLRAVVYTIPPKRKGLRIQPTDIILGEPGEGNPLYFMGSVVFLLKKADNFDICWKKKS